MISNLKLLKLYKINHKITLQKSYKPLSSLNLCNQPKASNVTFSKKRKLMYFFYLSAN
jgi:hypothetical protein